MNISGYETDEYTIKATSLYDSIGISSSEKLNIEKITDQYDEMIKALEKGNIKDSVYYMARYGV